MSGTTKLAEMVAELERLRAEVERLTRERDEARDVAAIWRDWAKGGDLPWEK